MYIAEICLVWLIDISYCRIIGIYHDNIWTVFQFVEGVIGMAISQAFNFLS